MSGDPYQRFSDDKCRHKHHGTDTSRAAWQKARRGRARCQIEVIDVLRLVWPDGLTGKEIASAIGKPFHAVSGRITELVEEDIVYRSAETRDGGHIVYLNGQRAGLESSLSNPSELEPGNPTQNARRAISELVDSDDYWAAVRVAYEHNIGIKLELPAATV